MRKGMTTDPPTSVAKQGPVLSASLQLAGQDAGLRVTGDIV